MANPNPKTDHLPKIKPGEVRNPNGSSKKQRLTNALVKMLDEKGLDEAFVKAGMAAALKGDFNFWKYIFERVDGKLPTPDSGDLIDQESVIFECADDAASPGSKPVLPPTETA